MLFIIIILLALALPAGVAFLVSRLVFNRLESSGVKRARIYQVITLILTFSIIFGGIAFLAYLNVTLER